MTDTEKLHLNLLILAGGGSAAVEITEWTERSSHSAISPRDGILGSISFHTC